MTAQTERRMYPTEAEPIRKTEPKIFQLCYDELGIGAVALMNERFRGNEHIELDPSRLRKGQPIGYSNIFRRGALGDAVIELMGGDTRPITPTESEIALAEGTLPLPQIGTGLCLNDEVLGLVLYPGEVDDISAPKSREIKYHLLRQAKERGVEVALPAIATGLSPVLDEDFGYGARLDLGESGEIYPAPVFKGRSVDFSSKDKGLVRRGVPDMPLEWGLGNRHLYISHGGACSLMRAEYYNLHAGCVNLSKTNLDTFVNFIIFADERENLEAERQR